MTRKKWWQSWLDLRCELLLEPECREPACPQCALRDLDFAFAKWAQFGLDAGGCHFTKRESAGICPPMTSANDEPGIGKRAALLRELLSDLAIMTVIGLFLGILGPF